MKFIFLGTRGEIDARSRCHRRHASLLVLHRHRRVMIDCGADWPTAFLMFTAGCDCPDPRRMGITHED
jgi:ribonuclease BN (tRNA processing enzyme)